MNRESNAKHTPAPWQAKRLTDEFFFVKDENGNTLATVWDRNQDLDGSANARLIAASPEMYETLKAFISAVPTDGTWNYKACVDKAISLIKKIEG